MEQIFLHHPRENQACGHPDPELLASKAGRWYISVVQVTQSVTAAPENEYSVLADILLTWKLVRERY